MAVLELLPQSMGSPLVADYASAFDAYLLGWDRPFSQATIGIVSWDHINDTTFSSRLSVLFNTYWLTSQWYNEIVDHANTNLTIYYNATTGDILPAYQQSTATVVRQQPVYKANYVCISLLIVVSTILLLCAIASLLLRLFIIAPDILGFVSSLTRDSPYFEPLPDAGSSLLSGPERARKLRDVKVQIADVRPSADVGHVAFVQVDRSTEDKEEGQTERGKVRKGRLYD